MSCLYIFPCTHNLPVLPIQTASVKRPKQRKMGANCSTFHILKAACCDRMQDLRGWETWTCNVLALVHVHVVLPVLSLTSSCKELLLAEDDDRRACRIPIVMSDIVPGTACSTGGTYMYVLVKYIITNPTFKTFELKGFHTLKVVPLEQRLSSLSPSP